MSIVDLGVADDHAAGTGQVKGLLEHWAHVAFGLLREAALPQGALRAQQTFSIGPPRGAPLLNDDMQQVPSLLIQCADAVLGILRQEPCMGEYGLPDLRGQLKLLQDLLADHARCPKGGLSRLLPSECLVVTGGDVPQVVHDIHKLMIPDEVQHSPARRGRLSAQLGEERIEVSGICAPVNQVPRLHQGGVAAGPTDATVPGEGGWPPCQRVSILGLLGEARGAQHHHRVFVVTVEVAE
mmetsp:Transcript_22012/g.62905  ORF Transcript_22012/g.62905 Transcript_22012/m.62905 type:complete len:239 (-) Transcript_22012:196-912(-)